MKAAELRDRIAMHGYHDVCDDELDALLDVAETGEKWRSAKCSRPCKTYEDAVRDNGCFGDNHVEECLAFNATNEHVAALNAWGAVPSHHENDHE